jgi:hypothetical protein
MGGILVEARLDRRLIVLRGKREVAFDAGQYWHERTPRMGAGRKLRTLLRVGRAVMLHTPRWSQAQRLLEDIAVDLQLGSPTVSCEVVNLQAVQGKSALQAWSWVMMRMTGFCGLPVERRLAQAVSRDGFRTLMGELLVRSASGPNRCVMLVGLEAVHLDALRDLLDVYHEHALAFGDRVRLNLLVAGADHPPHLASAGTSRLSLPDYAPAEAIESLVEQVGPQPVARLERIAALTGGIPALVDRIGSQGAAAMEEIVSTREAVWRHLGPLGAEIRSVFEIVWAEPALSKRLELLAKDGPQPEIWELDTRLLRSGLIRPLGHGTRTRVEIRAPVFGDMAHAG